MKHSHELRDPIHAFVRLSTDERKVLDSRPFQRLRHIHQLALSYLVYPGATHRRFEHSLGVMELADRVYQVVTRANLSDQVRALLPEVSDDYKREYWRKVLRMAALCHDLGHLPFSHAAEKELLPTGKTHESLTVLLVKSDEMASIWSDMKIDPQDVAKLALGPKEMHDAPFSTWETILSEIVVGDAFGVDRMDYLLRDSHHAGVAYGYFDHYRLIDTLRILSTPPSDENDGQDENLALGIEEGGIQSAEALLLARYFMYSQVYFHPVRRIYDIHLKDFMVEWLAPNGYPFEVDGHLAITDVEVLAAMRQAERHANVPGHQAARSILSRGHFKPIYTRNPADVAVDPEAGASILSALNAQFGAALFRRDRYTQRAGAPDFPVQMRNGTVASSLAVSEVLQRLPVVSIDTVYADPTIRAKAIRWLEQHQGEILQPLVEEDD